ncbi:MAG TPA: fatty acid desaturase [Acidimicrobiales bacterium]|nr:fatty acid desaturase [Acidimicrobiales bacterium]
MATTMVPPRALLPDVLPTDRLSAAGRLVPELRAALRRIPNARNAVAVAGAYLQTFGVIAAAVALHHPAAWVAAYFLMGRGHALLNILGHEAAHRILFSNRRSNDVIGRWALSGISFTPFDLYRRAHIAHHRDELGPDEPDLNLYTGYPIRPSSLRRKLTRDAMGVSGWKNLKGLIPAFLAPTSRRHATPIVITQVVLFGVAISLGRPELYVLLWLAPWMSVWKVLNRLRAIAEHGGMERSSDRRRTTHVVRQGPLARFWVVPYKTGWHLAHHVDMGIPYRHLPRLHRELVDAGWISDALEYRSYAALWRALASSR